MCPLSNKCIFLKKDFNTKLWTLFKKNVQCSVKKKKVQACHVTSVSTAKITRKAQGWKEAFNLQCHYSPWGPSEFKKHYTDNNKNYFLLSIHLAKDQKATGVYDGKRNIGQLKERTFDRAIDIRIIIKCSYKILIPKIFQRKVDNYWSNIVNIQTCPLNPFQPHDSSYVVTWHKNNLLI